uniref:DOCKER domain-containing protein n=1 Tax=Palpitomonas bilix TaxID=652834 RepID=A0A7S3LT78_9EUKA
MVIKLGATLSGGEMARLLAPPSEGRSDAGTNEGGEEAEQSTAEEGKEVFVTGLNETASVLLSTIEHFEKVPMASSDDSQAELQYALAVDAIHSVQLHVRRLDELSQTLMEAERFTESSMALLRIVAIGLDEAIQRQKNRHVVKEIENGFRRAWPDWQSYISHLRSSVEQADNSEGEDQCVITEEKLYRYADRACNMLQKAQMHEIKEGVILAVVPLLRERERYMKVYQLYQDLGATYRAIERDRKDGDRLFGPFYRVAFAGEGFGHLDGKVFVQKEAPLVRLGDVMEHYKGVFAQISIDMLDASKDIDTYKKEKPTGNGLAITSVSPLRPLQKSIEGATISHFQQEGGWFDEFYFDAPYSKQGKGPHTENVEDQWRRRTILRTSSSFPHLLRRQEVKSAEVVELAPIQNATESVKLKAAKIISGIQTLEETVKADSSLTMGSFKLRELIGAFANGGESLRNGEDYVTHVLKPEHLALLEHYLPNIISTSRPTAQVLAQLQKAKEQDHADLILPHSVVKGVKEYAKQTKRAEALLQQINAAVAAAGAESMVTLEVSGSGAMLIENFFDEKVKSAAEFVDALKKRIGQGRKPTVSQGAGAHENSIQIDILRVDADRLLKSLNYHVAVASNLDPKLFRDLQMQLQGSVRVQVNAGPIAFAKAFLSPDSSAENTTEAYRRELRAALTSFVKACKRGIEVS